MALLEREPTLCYIEVMGTPRVTRAGQTLTQFGTHKTGALLVWLALHPGPQPRERVIDMFWPDMELSAGRNNLSTTLVALRRLLEPAGIRRGDVLIANHNEVGLNADAISTDAAIFEALLKLAAAAEVPDRRIDLLRRAVDLYRGEILPASYHDWAIQATERLQSRMLRGLDQLSQDLERRHDPAGALEILLRAISLDPYSEALHCRLVNLYVQTGRPATARDAHDRFARLLREEFGASPSVATEQAVSGLLASYPSLTVESTARASRMSGRAPFAGTPTHSPEPAANIPRSPILPVVLSRFFGREAELRELARLLLPTKNTPVGPDEPEQPGRLVTLTGPGGIGKTRLAIEFARRIAARSTAWCGFVPLAELMDANKVERQLAEALRLPEDTSVPPLERVTAFLLRQDHPDAPPLLIIDNLEHLLDASPAQSLTISSILPDTVRALLEKVPGLLIVCTSRRRLGLRGERLLPVDCLPFPAEIATDLSEDALSSLLLLPAVRLYLDRAQAVRPDFGLTPTNARAIAALCRQLEGSPLALELAAAWVRVLPPRKMWERLTQGLDLPAGSYADLPARHRTLTAALDWSFRLLTAPSQRLLARLSVFHGGWNIEGADAVCEEPSSLELLTELRESSLVVTTEDADGQVRYSFLETIRVFGAQHLTASGEIDHLQTRHADYFLSLAEEAAKHQRGADQAVWLARLTTEHENIRAVMNWWLASSEIDGDIAFGARLVAALHRFWYVRGHWREGLAFTEIVLSRAREGEPSPMLAKVLGSAASLNSALGDLRAAQALQEEALAIWRTVNDIRAVGDVLHNLGLMALMQGDLDRAEVLYRESLAIQRERNDDLGIADELHHLGMVAHERGDLAAAQRQYEESLALRKPFGDLRGIAFSLQNMANVAFSLGDHARARGLCEENLAIRRELGDRKGIGDAHHNLGVYIQAAGEGARAKGLYRQALAMRHEMSDWQGAAESIETFGHLFADQELFARAARLYAVAEAVRTKIGAARTPYEQAMHEPRVRDVRAKLSSAEAAALASAAGQDTWEQTIEELLRD